MATTPPPPPGRRIHTPPGPLHSPQHDAYQPYSPRRSSRIAQSHNHSLGLNTSPPTVISPIARDSTPKPARRATLARTTSQTFSPPSSPNTSPLRTSPRVARQSHGVGNIQVPTNNKPTSFTTTDSDSDIFGTTPASRKRSRMESLGMLPTPSKTPRKTPAKTSAAVASTARVLFPSRSTTLDDVMPTPRRGRMARHNLAFEGINGGGSGRSSKIEIFQDSRDRVPDVDRAEENPFMVKRSPRQKPVRSGGDVIKGRKAKARHESRLEVEEAIENDEGIVYVFRGKKVFRKFEDIHAQGSGGEDSDAPGDNESILRRAGAAITNPTRPFTRSSIKPRLLFPSKDQVNHRQHPGTDDVDEEDVTDIDESRIPSSSEHLEDDDHATVSTNDEAHEGELVTPVKDHKFNPATPPPTARKTRASAKKGTPGLDASPNAPEPREFVPIPVSKTRGKRASPFDAWQRTKPGFRTVGKGTKREGDVLEKESAEGVTVGKRTRSGAHGV